MNGKQCPEYNRNILEWTPLHEASRIESVEIVKLLLDKGEDVNANDSKGRTYLDVGRK